MLSSLLQPGNTYSEETTPRLIVVAHPEGRSIEMEFMAVLEQENLEDRLAHLAEEDQEWDEREISFRLLRHHAASVRHQKYQGIDIVTVKVGQVLSSRIGVRFSGPTRPNRE